MKLCDLSRDRLRARMSSSRTAPAAVPLPNGLERERAEDIEREHKD